MALGLPCRFCRSVAPRLISLSAYGRTFRRAAGRPTSERPAPPYVPVLQQPQQVAPIVAVPQHEPQFSFRFYEHRNILGAPAPSSSGYRVYSERTLAELAFVKRAQQLGFSLEEIREMLSLGRGGRLSCNRVSALCDTHLQRIERRMEERQRFKRQLLQAQRKRQRRAAGSQAKGSAKQSWEAECRAPTPSRRAKCRLTVSSGCGILEWC